MSCEKKRFLGIEFGSTRIKAVLIDGNGQVLASGAYGWENHLENGFWTYSMTEVLTGLQSCFASLSEDWKRKTGEPLTSVTSMGISGMQHGYLPFDRNGKQLVPFRTWRNGVASEISDELSRVFSFYIPRRWSVAHLYAAVRNGEPHIAELASINTLAGHIHYLLTGKRVVGMGEASGMFPLDYRIGDYDGEKLQQFDRLCKGVIPPVRTLLPSVLSAGEPAGVLTEAGAKLLDPTGTLRPGIPFCPPEGDAATGMTATDSVRPGTGNISAGTSIFAMAVMEKPPVSALPEIDMLATPAGDPVALVHCNNCTGELDFWVKLLGEAAKKLGGSFDTDTLYSVLYSSALEGDPACTGMMSYNCIAGEHIMGLESGSPLFFRSPESEVTLGGFMRTQISAACAGIAMGMEILKQEKGFSLSSITGHGGFFKAGETARRIMSSALNVPVRVASTAGEGGPWGMAILASYRTERTEGESLGDYLDRKIFASEEAFVTEPVPEEVEGFRQYLERYRKGLTAERAAAELWK